MKTNIFLFFSVLCLIAAGIHILGIFGIVDESPPLRHLFFALLSLWGAWLMQKRPAFLVYLFPILLVQQYYGHGRRAYHWWIDKGQVDWVSVLVLIILPIAYYFIWVDFHQKK